MAAVDQGLGVNQLWGFSPAQALPLHALQHVLCAGCADLRHLLVSVADSKKEEEDEDDEKPTECVVLEESPVCQARHMLLLLVLLDRDTHGPNVRAQFYLEILGSTLVRPATAEYVRALASRVERFVSDPEVDEELGAWVDLSQLKFKERDEIEAAVRAWRRLPASGSGAAPHKDKLDVCALRTQRLRAYYGERFDARVNLADWDYYMRLKERAPIMHPAHYKQWRESGVAFELRDIEYDAPNVTLCTDRVATDRARRGAKVRAQGYWGDILVGPYVGLGLESPDESLFERRNEQFTHTAIDVALSNVTHIARALDAAAAAGKPPFRLVPIGSEATLFRKPHYKAAFERVFIGYGFVTLLLLVGDAAAPSLASVVAPGAIVSVETLALVAPLSDEQQAAWSQKLEEAARALGWSVADERQEQKERQQLKFTVAASSAST